MRPSVPRRPEHLASGFLLSCLMSLPISGMTTVLAIGLAPGVAMRWLSAWLSSGAVAFPTALVVAPFVRRVLHRAVVPAG
jgi:hypothetical protein